MVHGRVIEGDEELLERRAVLAGSNQRGFLVALAVDWEEVLGRASGVEDL